MNRLTTLVLGALLIASGAVSQQFTISQPIGTDTFGARSSGQTFTPSVGVTPSPGAPATLPLAKVTLYRGNLGANIPSTTTWLNIYDGDPNAGGNLVGVSDNSIDVTGLVFHAPMVWSFSQVPLSFTTLHWAVMSSTPGLLTLVECSLETAPRTTNPYTGGAGIIGGLIQHTASVDARFEFVFGLPPASKWGRLRPAHAPGNRIEPAMAYDSGNGVSVLFGGADVGGFPPQAFADTWRWNGVDWSQAATSGPSGRYFAGMCYDSLRSATVLYGGLAPTFFGANYRDDTWEWNGSSWAQVVTVNTPGSLIGNPGIGEHAMAFDPVGNRAVLFGGELFSGIVPSGSTFEYDGIDWTLVTPATSPSPRSQASMCSAPTLGGVLMFGGTNFNNPPGPGGQITWNDLWVYTSANDTWTQLTTTGAAPAPRAGASLLFDSIHGVYVMHGGYADAPTGAIPLADTWVFDGSSWYDVSAVAGNPTAPLVRFATADGPNGCHVLFGGADSFFGAARSETWTYGTCATAVRFGTGCLGSNGVPSLAAAARPLVGTTYPLAATNLATASAFGFVITGFSNTTSPLGSLPVNLSLIGLDPSCFLRCSSDATALIATTGGAGTFNFTIPRNLLFLGTVLHHQAGSIDSGATGGFAVSNGVSSLIGID